MKKPWFLRGIRIWGGWGKAPTTPYAVLFSGQGASSSPCTGRSSPDSALAVHLRILRRLGWTRRALRTAARTSAYFGSLPKAGM